MNPAERLCSRTWRLSNSAWMLTSLLGLGLVTWAGFLYIGVKARRRSWLIAAGAWAGYVATYIVLSELFPGGTKEDPNTANSWVGGIVHQALVNRQWLRWRAVHPRGSTVWYRMETQGQAPITSAERVDATLAAALHRPPVQAPPVGPPPANQSDAQSRSLWSAPPQRVAPAGSLDINSATESDLVAVGVDGAWAAVIVAARQRVGRFNAPEDLMTRGGLPPHVFMAVRDRLVVTPVAPPQPAPHGRRLDL